MNHNNRNRLILEFTEFNAQRLNPDSAQMSVQVDNPQLSVNAFDKHEDAIRAGIAKINGILHSLSNTASFRSLKSKLALENQKIESMKVQRIVKYNEVTYDAYISFVIGDDEYYGVIKNLLDKSPSFQSEVFKDTDLIQTREWVIRTKGMIINIVKKWLKPEKGIYKLINKNVFCYDNETGKMIELTQGDEIEVVNSNNNSITIRRDDRLHSLVNDNFVYFNWWFESK